MKLKQRMRYKQVEKHFRQFQHTIDRLAYNNDAYDGWVKRLQKSLKQAAQEREAAIVERDAAQAKLVTQEEELAQLRATVQELTGAKRVNHRQRRKAERMVK